MAETENKKDNIAPALDYGWRSRGKPILLHEDHSAVVDESFHLMQTALTQMSQKYFYVERCIQCGMCTEACPNTMLNMKDRFSPREFIQKLRLGMLNFSGEDLWFCTNCGGCTNVCPYEIPFVDVMVDLRNLVVEQGAGYLPSSIKSALTSERNYRNPWMEASQTRGDWIKKLKIPLLEKDSANGILLFVGCFPSYDERAKKIAEAAAQLLNKAGIQFDILGEEEACCGDSVRRSGDYETFGQLKTINLGNFKRRGLKNIYTLSPHCFDVMKNYYFDKKDDAFSVNPFILLLHEIVTKKKLKIDKVFNKIVTFHDPCFLGKHNNIIKEPREILKTLPAIQFREMEHNGMKSICCGGGGGGIWLDRKKGERLAEIRLEEAVQTRADILVTACPFCLSMLEGSAKGDSKFEGIEIMDISELVLKSV